MKYRPLLFVVALTLASLCGRSGAAPDTVMVPPTITQITMNRADANSDRQAQLKESIAGRSMQVRALLDAQVVGESHTGLLVARKNVQLDQQAIINLENRDRSELFELQATQTAASIPQVALRFYKERLACARKGDWVEHYHINTHRWEWFQWDR